MEATDFTFSGRPNYSDTTQTIAFTTDSRTFSFYNLNGYSTFDGRTPAAGDYRTFTVIVTDNNSEKTYTFTITNLGISYNNVPAVSATTTVNDY